MELFRPDKPIDAESEDRFQRYPFARRIAEVASTGKYSSSLVIGVYGKWGEGKTSVMNCIQREIGDKAVVINFNPWLFTNENQLLKSFFSNIAAAIGQQLKSKKERALEVFGDYADGIGSLVNLAAPGWGSLFGTGKKISEKLRKDSIEALKKKVDDLVIEANTNFVIFIDDIDRLDIQEVQADFKLVKLVGDFPRTAYVLSFDDDMVASALAPKYAGDNKTAGYNFLEKIIQMPMLLPKASPLALRTFSFDLFNNVFQHLQIDLSELEQWSFVSKFDKAFLPALSTPRLAVRYANSIGFSIPLLKDEVNISDFIIIEGIKIFYPTLYHFIRNNQECFTSNFTNYGNTFSGMGPNEKEIIKTNIKVELEKYTLKEKIQSMLMELFPQLKSLYNNYSFSVETYQQWHREKRICSPQHFTRYFSFAVQKEDISDAYFKQLLSGLDSENMTSLRVRFEMELLKLQPDTFIFKLKNFVAVFTEKEAATLSELLGYFGDYFPLSNRLLVFTGRDEVAYLIRELLEKVSTEKRGLVANRVLEQAKPLEFAVEIFIRLKNRQHHIEDTPFLEVDERVALADPLVKRFEEQVKQQSLFEVLPDYALWIMFGLYHDKNRSEEISLLLSEKLRESSSYSLQILKIFTPTLYSSARPGAFKANFSSESFEDLRKYIDLQQLYQATINTYGQPPFKPVIDPLNTELTDENLVALFQKMYQEANI